MAFKILLVEDEPALGRLIKDQLIEAQYNVRCASDGEEATLVFNEFLPDLCLLDVMIPKKDGFEVAREIHAKNPLVSIIFLTAKTMPESVVKGFNLGADDYVTKPFRMEELLLRVNAVLNRSLRDDKKEDHVYEVGASKLNANSQELIVHESVKQLSHKEAALLELLIQYKNKVLSRDVALNKVWGQHTFSNSRSMDVYVVKLRKHLSKDTSIKIINVWGEGFKLVTN